MRWLPKALRRKDIVIYDRYKSQFLEAGFDKWVPEGVRMQPEHVEIAGALGLGVADRAKIELLEIQLS